MNALKGKKAAYYTLGCKLNFAETSTIRQQMEAAGVETVGRGEVADICIVNTCSVTEVADSKCRQAVSRLRHRHPGALMVVTGCYAQLRLLGGSPAKEEDRKCLENIDLVVSAKQKGEIVELIQNSKFKIQIEGQGARNKEQDIRGEEQGAGSKEQGAKSEEQGAGGEEQGARSKEQGARSKEQDIRGEEQGARGKRSIVNDFAPACARGERTRFFLKVQDGCDYFCTYCTIPFARGRSRNGSIESLVRQAQEAASEGGKEIVLTGVNIGDFGKTTGERFIDLLRALDEVEGIERYRISSIEPNLLTEEVIRFCADSRAFMPHFHIPLQSGSDEVLRLMHRHYDTRFFREKIEEVRTHIPDAFIGVDVIVGMRGETDELFAQSLAFMQSLPVSQYHVFSYSERPGTKALNIPGKVTPEEKHKRSQQVLSLSNEKLHTYYNIYIGQTRPVLLERPPSYSPEGEKILHGFTDNYIRVEVSPNPKPPSHSPLKGEKAGEKPAKEASPLRGGLEGLSNTIVQVRLGEWNEAGDALKGTVSPDLSNGGEKGG